MATLTEHLNNPGYENWLKAGLSLLYLREGLSDYVESETRTLHSNILTAVFGPSGHVTQCMTCTSGNIRQKNGFWGISCSSKICNDIQREILIHHVSPKSKGIAWRNSDVQRWTTDVWEVAKCYMSPLDDPSNIRGVQSTDVSAVLNLIIHCQWFHRRISANFGNKNNVFQQVRDCRNEIMHSLDMKLTSMQLTAMTDSMIAVLEDPAYIVSLPQAKVAVNNIRQLRSSSQPISPGDELKVLQTKLQTVEQRLDKYSLSLRKSTDSLQDDQNLLLGKMGDLRLELAASENRTVEQVKNCMQTVEGIRDEFDIKMRENTLIRDEIRTLRDRIISGIALEPVKQQCMKLERACSNFDSELNKAQEEVRSMRQKVEVALEKITELCSQIEFTDFRMSSAEERLAQVEITTKTNQVETTEAEFAELRKELVEIYRETFSDIPVSPLFEDECVEMKHVFSPVVILETTASSGKEQKTENKRIVKGYRDIFYKGNQKMKKIYLRGKAGYGKTTWCYHMLNTWCNTQSKLVSGEQMSDDEKSMSEFDFLFFVSLRLINEGNRSRNGEGVGEKLHQGICNQLFGVHSKFQVVVLNVLKTKPERTLLLFDGLDESDIKSDFLVRKHYRGTTTICTTRPWKLESLHLKPTEIDLVLELDGLDENCVTTLASAILTAFHGIEDMETVKKCVTALTLSNLTALLKIPLIVVFIVHYWHMEEKLPNSLTENFVNIIECLFQRGMDKISDGDRTITASGNVSIFLGALPNQFKGREMCNKYAIIIQILGRLALEGLLSDKKENALVFSQKTLNEKVSYMLQEASQVSRQNLSDSDKKESVISAERLLEISLKVGILSKTKVPSALIRESVLTFMHKSVQEFLAAVWIVSSRNNSAFRDLCVYCDSLEKTLDMSNVLPFLCGLSPELGVQLSAHISDLSSRDSDMTKYRLKLTGDNAKVVAITDMMISCKTEVENTEKDKEISLRVDDLSLGFLNANLEPNTVFDMIVSNQSNLKSLQFYCFDGSGVVGYVLWKTLYSMEDMMFENLSRFDMELVEVSAEPLNVNADAIKKAIPKLKVLKINVIGTKDREVALCLTKFPQLKSIQFGAQLTQIGWQQFADHLLLMPQVTNLVLNATDLHGIKLDLSNLRCLRHLRLEDIEMARTTWTFLHNSIKNLKSIRHLHVDVTFHEIQSSSDTCALHLTDFPELRHFDLAKTSLDSIILNVPALQTIFLRNLVLAEDVEMALFSSLKNSQCLKTLDVDGPTNANCLHVLIDTIRVLPNLREISFCQTDFCNVLPDLSHLTLLEKLTFLDVKMKCETQCFVSEMLHNMPNIMCFVVQHRHNPALEHIVVPTRFTRHTTRICSKSRGVHDTWEQVCDTADRH